MCVCVCVSTGEPRARACAQVNRWGWECWSVTSTGTRCEVQPWRKLVHDTSLNVTAARRRLVFILRVLSQQGIKITRRLFLHSCVRSSRDPRLRLAPLRRRSRAHTCTYAHSQPSITSAAEAAAEARHGGRRALTLGRSVHVSAERSRMERAEEKL